MFDSPLAVAGAILAGYLAGTLPTGVLVARWKGVDIRQVGSGNIGATNVARTLGKPLGALVLAVDALKGFLPAWGAIRLGAPPWVVALVGLAAILGHVLPVWLRFRGGKGVATAFGVFLAVAPVAALCSFALYFGIYLAFRISSLGSLASSTAMVGAMLATGRPTPYVALATAAWLLILFRHRGNIRRLIRREERKI